MKPKFTRREFIKKTTTAGAVASLGSGFFAPSVLQTTRTPAGRKGKAYPDERRKYTDSKSGRTVWQLTKSPAGRMCSYSYYNVPKATPDGRWALYSSDRYSTTAGKLDLFKMDLRTGESVQLTESSDIEARDNVVMTADGKEVYFFDSEKNLRVLDMESMKERKIMQLPGNVQRPRHNSSVSPDKRFVLTARPLERQARYDYMTPLNLHNALIAIRTDNGQTHNLVEGMFPIGINEYCPTNPDLIMWDIHGEWTEVQRPHVIKSDGTGNRPVMQTTKGEGSGHQYWGWTGQVIYSVMYAGRYPQGIWAVDWPSGTNERCVGIGGTHAHAASSPQEDVFVQDEVFGQTDALFVSRKGSPRAQILCQMNPWMLLKGDVWESTPFHAHQRFLASGNAVAFSAKSDSGSGDIWLVEL